MSDEKEKLASGLPMPNEPTTHVGYKDHIVDRTGELLAKAVAVAQEFPRPNVVGVTDPMDPDVHAIVAVGSNGVHVVPDTVFDEYRTQPRLIKGTATVTRLISFVELVRRFRLDETAIFANTGPSPSLLAVIDYHNYEQPNNGRNRISYPFPLSEEWRAWMGSNGEKMPYADFARFLEDRVFDVETITSDTELSDELKKLVAASGKALASGDKLRELSVGLKINENATFQEARNLSSGEGVLHFKAEHVDDAGQPVDVPNLFIINIPIFDGSPDVYRIAARLRYRRAGTGVVFWYDLVKPDACKDHAVEEACDYVVKETCAPLFFGTPHI